MRNYPSTDDSVMYVCTKCHGRFNHKVPRVILGLIKKQIKCPSCGGKTIQDPAIKY